MARGFYSRWRRSRRNFSTPWDQSEKLSRRPAMFPARNIRVPCTICISLGAVETRLGARGGGRTHTSRKGQGILSPPRMPFRHPGAVAVNLFYQESYCNTGTATAGCSKALVSVVVSAEVSVGASKLFYGGKRVLRGQVGMPHRQGDRLVPQKLLHGANVHLGHNSKRLAKVCRRQCQLEPLRPASLDRTLESHFNFLPSEIVFRWSSAEPSANIGVTGAAVCAQ